MDRRLAVLEHASAALVQRGGHFGQDRGGHAFRYVATDIQADGVVQAVQRGQLCGVLANFPQQALGALAIPDQGVERREQRGGLDAILLHRVHARKIRQRYRGYLRGGGLR